MEEFRRIKRELVAKVRSLIIIRTPCRFPTVTLQMGSDRS